MDDNKKADETLKQAEHDVELSAARLENAIDQLEDKIESKTQVIRKIVSAVKQVDPKVYAIGGASLVSGIVLTSIWKRRKHDGKAVQR